MSSIHMTNNNNKSVKSFKSTKSTKDNEMHAYFSKRVDDVPVTETSNAPAQVVPAAAELDIETMAETATPETPAAASTPMAPPEVVAARLVTDEQVKRQYAARNDPPMCRLMEETMTPMAAMTPMIPPEFGEQAMRNQFIRTGPPPEFRLNCEAAPVSSEQKLIDSMLGFIDTQRKALEMMMAQREQSVPQFNPFQMMNFPPPPPLPPFVPTFTAPPEMPVQPVRQVVLAQRPADAPSYQGMKPIFRTQQVAQAAQPAKAAQPQKHEKQEKHEKHQKPKAKDAPQVEENPEFAPFDLELNEECPDGFNCPNSKNPFMCPKNHQKYGNTIKKDAKLPQFFCKWERPWKNGPNTKPLRCRKPNCYLAHLKGRKEFIAYASAKQDEAANASAANALEESSSEKKDAE
jgi:hypothetical protein